MPLRHTRRLTAALAGLTAALVTAPALAAGSGTITVPDDFVPSLSATRTAGHYEVIGTGLRVWTEPSVPPPGTPNQSKVAEYVATSTPLTQVGEPGLDVTKTSGQDIPPGFQLVTDVDADGTVDAILVGEKAYNGEWWAASANQKVKDGAPATGEGFGSPYHGTLDQWRTAFPNAVVKAYGFSLGSGVVGDWTINAISFAGTRYTFAKAVVLKSAQECKDGGWATSTKPVFRNQGECVSSFASAK